MLRDIYFFMDDQALEGKWVANKLFQQKYIGQAEAQKIENISTEGSGKDIHLFEEIASLSIRSLKADDKFLNVDTLMYWLSLECQLDVFHIDPLKVNVPQITSIMSFEFAKRHKILAIESTPSEVVIATAQPFIIKWKTLLEQTLSGRKVRCVLCLPAQIRRYTSEFYSMSQLVRKAGSNEGLISGVGNFEQMLELGAKSSSDASDAHIVSIVDWLLQYAFDQRASDVHIEPRRETINVRFRIDGIMHQIYQLPVAVGAAVLSRFKVLGRMDVAEKRRPQDGRIKTKRNADEELELRLSTLPTAFGEKLVIRVFDPDVLLRPFDQLGMLEEELDQWKEMVGNTHGILLVTGPTGSGKTTTLYSTLRHLSTPEVNVCTVEDPIEMVEPMFNQMQVQSTISLGFSDGVRALLRQDPDIIMIGEIRDIETAEMAIQAALTGHLVLSSLHTNDAPSAVVRMLELGVAPYLIRSTLIGVMAQRLVRRLCRFCKREVALDIEGWNLLNRPFNMKPVSSMWVPKGCVSCRSTGYHGRIGLYELLSVDLEIQKLISAKMDIVDLKRKALNLGMSTLRMNGAVEVTKGNTSIDEVLRVVSAF